MRVAANLCQILHKRSVFLAKKPRKIPHEGIKQGNYPSRVFKKIFFLEKKKDHDIEMMAALIYFPLPSPMKER